MKRRNFIEFTAVTASAFAFQNAAGFPLLSFFPAEISADLVIAGGSLGGCAAALSALKNNLKVVLTVDSDWIGGQLTQQGVPPDEHQWIETHGSTRTYRQLRTAIRNYYKQHYPLTPAAMGRPYLNPGDGTVSALCCEPRVAEAVLHSMLAPYIHTKKLILLTDHAIVNADVTGDKIRSLNATGSKTGKTITLTAPYFIDATELGDLLPLTGTEYVTGAESKKQTGELHAPEKADPNNQQAFTMCFAMEHIDGANNVIDKPREYDHWRNFIPGLNPPWPGKLLDLTYSNPQTLAKRTVAFDPAGNSTGDKMNLWTYRRIINKQNFTSGFFKGDITIVNWPQNDYLPGNLIDVGKEEFNTHVDAAKQLSLSLFYWLQTGVPRPDGGGGWPGLRLRGDVLGTADGMAKRPYIRESRRIKAIFTVLEEHVGAENRALVAGKEDAGKSAIFHDTVGTGYYRIDLHPGTGGVNYIDIASLPFQIPLGALLPQRMENLLPACKNIGTTHITNGCYRLHPVEWSIGEAAGLLAAFAINKKVIPKAVRENPQLLNDFQQLVHSSGLDTHWP
ncbi:MAG: FAD-dependent oxidoreductase [Mucilaginibacter sp.]|nr:FAD-dependent oxidoreductase [Mucilaginibacter sp.]